MFLINYIMIEISVIGLNGHITNLRLRSTSVDNIKRRIYKYFKSQSTSYVDADGKINKYHMKYQILLLNTEFLQDDVLKNGDVITLLLDNTAIQKDVHKLEKYNEFLQQLNEQFELSKLSRFN